MGDRKFWSRHYKVVRERRYPAYGYIVRTLRLREDDTGRSDHRFAFTLDGDVFIGDARVAAFFCKKHGVRPQPRTATSAVCSIGFSESEQAWYGWSHRACGKFTVGHVVKPGSVLAGVGAIRVGFKAKTLADCEKLARKFAEAVS